MTMTATRSSLSVIASAVSRTISGHEEAAVWDAGFDGGEFSGPAHYRMMAAAVARALAEHGWSAAEFEDELTARTSAAYVFRSGLTAVFEPAE